MSSHTYTVRIPHERIDATDAVIRSYMESNPGAIVEDALDAIFARGVAVGFPEARLRERFLFLEVEEELHL